MNDFKKILSKYFPIIRDILIFSAAIASAGGNPIFFQGGGLAIS